MVFLATGRNGQVPRRYRGRDILLWLMENGRYDQPRTVQSGRPLLGAGHTLSLQLLSGLGIVLLGRLTGVGRGGELMFADDLAEHAAYAERVSADLRREIDDYIAAKGIDAPPAEIDAAEAAPARFPEPPILELDLVAAGITTSVIWSTGFRGDYRWLQVPGATDAEGQPAQSRCVSVPGVFFAGIDFGPRRSSPARSWSWRRRRAGSPRASRRAGRTAEPYGAAEGRPDGEAGLLLREPAASSSRLRIDLPARALSAAPPPPEGRATSRRWSSTSSSPGAGLGGAQALGGVAAGARALRVGAAPGLGVHDALLLGRRVAARLGIGAERGGGRVDARRLVAGLAAVDLLAEPIDSRGFGFACHGLLPGVCGGSTRDGWMRSAVPAWHMARSRDHSG